MESKKKLFERNLNVCAGNERCIYSSGVSRDQWAPIKQRDGKILRHMLWDSHRLPLQFGFVVVQLYLILKQFYSDQEVFQKCQPSSECVSPTKNTARTSQREEMSPNHWNHKRRNILLDLFFLDYSSSSSVGPRYFRSSRVLGWDNLNLKKIWVRKDYFTEWVLTCLRGSRNQIS